ncbi:alpha,alpha-trehalase TreF [Spirosoma luteolum]
MPVPNPRDTRQSPDQLFGPLFEAVQRQHLFADSKTFVDCVPQQAPDQILAAYEVAVGQPNFSLDAFVQTHFAVPVPVGGNYVSDREAGTVTHIHRLWDHLTRSADRPIPYHSRLPLPHPYVVPGGRFREIFYWDSYFTMIGLRESGRLDLIRGMLDNFAFLIDTVGYIPNGNRTYFLSRSQPPFFALMVGLLAEIDGPNVLLRYLPQLQREHDFWLAGADALSPASRCSCRTVWLPGQSAGTVNRYWDDTPTPRPEAWREEVELKERNHLDEEAAAGLFTHIRAACESGWDFSSRWLGDEATMVTNRAADIAPVDLACLLYSLEKTLADGYRLTADTALADTYAAAAEHRRGQVQTLFWNEQTGFYHDIDWTTGGQTPVLSLAGAFPLFLGLATPEQASRVHDRLAADFLQAGGWVTTLNQTGQQWDWPNGWAPLQWIVYEGLRRYGFTDTARAGSSRWVALNDRVFAATGKMMEKYNVVDAALTTGGGEYPNQDGFGWTNGVYLGLMRIE